jgi:hypothetical protein
MAKLRRTPFRCRGCHNRFYIYVPRDKDDVEDVASPEETPESESAAPGEEEEHKPDLAKRAEP